MYREAVLRLNKAGEPVAIFGVMVLMLLLAFTESKMWHIVGALILTTGIAMNWMPLNKPKYTDITRILGMAMYLIGVTLWIDYTYETQFRQTIVALAVVCAIVGQYMMCIPLDNEWMPRHIAVFWLGIVIVIYYACVDYVTSLCAM